MGSIKSKNYGIAILTVIMAVSGGLIGTNLGKFIYTEKTNGSQNVVGVPKSLIIPSLSVSTNVESVGLDNERAMDVPKDVMNVGWYNLGVKPGEIGNAVIDGHLDSKTGPAIFYRLDNLKKDDVVIVVDQKGKELQFKVVNKINYDEKSFPIESVFGETNKIRLNLVTCTGIYNRDVHTYTKRLVVFTELMN